MPFSNDIVDYKIVSSASGSKFSDGGGFKDEDSQPENVIGCDKDE